jgi:hypothetical protein
MKWTTILLLSTAVVAQKSLAPGCPAVATQPGGRQPKNCPNPDTLPATKGTAKDNECTVAGIMGVSLTVSHPVHKYSLIQRRATSGMHASPLTWYRP